jgi:CRISPR-associated endonuclease/helicase Cas3
MDFDELVGRATGGMVAYGFQRRLAAEGLPDLLCVPTRAGKTLAAVLPWLYRRTGYPEPDVRAATSRWLVIVLPQRTLVEQTVRVIRGWLANLASAVPVHVLMGGEDIGDSRWRYERRVGRMARFLLGRTFSSDPLRTGYVEFHISSFMSTTRLC